MTTNYLSADETTLQMAETIIAEHHPWLKNARIAVMLREGEAPRTDGKLTLGQTSLVNAKMKALAREKYDFFIWLAGDWWADARDEERRALLDHELCHCGGEAMAWKLRGHDVQEFAVIAQRHGLWYGELRNFVRAATEGSETSGPAYQRDLAVAEPMGKVGTINCGGISEVTLSSRTRSVTLTADTARKAGAMLAEIAQAQK